jgi:SpoVK/Ycf46/Vps4 family AAA+-type ATPase
MDDADWRAFAIRASAYGGRNAFFLWNSRPDMDMKDIMLLNDNGAMADKTFNIDAEFVHLARIALSGRTQDVQALIQRTIRRAQRFSPELAGSLISLLKESPTRSSPLRRQSEVPLPVDIDSRLQLMKVEEIPILEWEPVFVPYIASQLAGLVEERRKPDALRRAALEPTRTALFVGPPGVGKTLAARWVARELGRPLLTLDLAAVMSSYLGRTGGNLRLVLDYAKSIDCVLLLDELDAIAKRRDDRGEIGELKRLVTVLIQQIDDWPSSNLLLAATNHAELLDPAIWRRFEVVMEFPLPDQGAIRSFAEQTLIAVAPEAANWASILAIVLEGKSYSEITRELANARRRAALKGSVLGEELIELIRSEKMTKQARIDLAVSLVKEGAMSQRKACEVTGVARDTIRNRIGGDAVGDNAERSE